ncbi:MAG: sulfite exporter TauE/SafE family protein [Aggregatilineales bacterium]
MTQSQSLQIGLIAAACLLIGLSKGGLGGPVPVALTTPLLSAVLPVSQAVSLAVPLLIIADGFALWAYWRDWDMSRIRLMLPPAVLGVALGLFMLASLPDLWLRRLLGLFTLLFVIYKAGGWRVSGLKYQHHSWHGWLAGGASGFASALANLGAPPFTVYMLLQDVPPAVFVGTTTLFFAIINLLKLPVVVAAGLLNIPLLVSAAWAIPLIPLGVWLGRQFINRVSPKLFENIMLALLLVAAAALLLSPAA